MSEQNQTPDNQERDDVDWERIQIQYRAGALSLREIAALHPGTNHVQITRRAKKEGWTRDLSEQTRIAASQVVLNSVAGSNLTEEQIIAQGANAILRVKQLHRRGISKTRRTLRKLMDEVAEQTSNKRLFEQLGDLMSDPEGNKDKLNEIYHKCLSLPSRVDSARKLASALKDVVDMERKAYNIDAEPTTGANVSINVQTATDDDLMRILNNQ